MSRVTTLPLPQASARPFAQSKATISEGHVSPVVHGHFLTSGPLSHSADRPVLSLNPQSTCPQAQAPEELPGELHSEACARTQASVHTHATHVYTLNTTAFMAVHT